MHIGLILDYMSTKIRKRINPALVQIVDSVDSGNNCGDVLSVQTHSFCILQNVMILVSNNGEIHYIQSEQSKGSRFDPSSFENSASALKKRTKSFKIIDLNLLEQCKGRSPRRKACSSIISVLAYFHNLIILPARSDTLFVLENVHESLERSSGKDTISLREVLSQSVGASNLLSIDAIEISPAFGFIGSLDDNGALHVMCGENVQLRTAGGAISNSSSFRIQAEERVPVYDGICDATCMRFSASRQGAKNNASCSYECLLVTGMKGEVRIWTCEKRKDTGAEFIKISAQRVLSVSSSSVVTSLCWVHPTLNGVGLIGSTSNGILYFWGSTGDCDKVAVWKLLLANEHSTAPINHITVCSHGDTDDLNSEQWAYENEDVALRRGLVLTGDLMGCIRLYRPNMLAAQTFDNNTEANDTLSETSDSLSDQFSGRSSTREFIFLYIIVLRLDGACFLICLLKNIMFRIFLIVKKHSIAPPLFGLVAEFKLNGACKGIFVSRDINGEVGDDFFITFASEKGEIKQFDEQSLPIRQPSLPSAVANIGREGFESDVLDAHKSIMKLSVMQKSPTITGANVKGECPSPLLDESSSPCPVPRSPLHLSFESIDDCNLLASADTEARTSFPTPHQFMTLSRDETQTLTPPSFPGNTFTVGEGILADLESAKSSPLASCIAHKNGPRRTDSRIKSDTIQNAEALKRNLNEDDDDSSTSNKSYLPDSLSTSTLHSTLIYQQFLKEKRIVSGKQLNSKATSFNGERQISKVEFKKRETVYSNLTQIYDKSCGINDCKRQMRKKEKYSKKVEKF